MYIIAHPSNQALENKNLKATLNSNIVSKKATRHCFTQTVSQKVTTIATQTIIQKVAGIETQTDAEKIETIPSQANLIVQSRSPAKSTRKHKDTYRYNYCFFTIVYEASRLIK